MYFIVILRKISPTKLQKFYSYIFFRASFKDSINFIPTASGPLLQRTDEIIIVLFCEQTLSKIYTGCPENTTKRLSVHHTYFRNTLYKIVQNK